MIIFYIDIRSRPRSGTTPVMDGFPLYPRDRKDKKGQNRAGILSNSWYPYYFTGAVAFTGRHLLCAYVIIYEVSVQNESAQKLDIPCP